MAAFSITDVGTATGGVGPDTLTYIATTGTGVVLTGMTGDLLAGYDGTFNGTGTNDGVFTDIENFVFTDSAGGADNITTGDGIDVLNLGGGDDTGAGAGGADSINGGSGLNTLYGGDGNDTFTGGNALDKAYGGNDDDVFNIGNGIDSIFGGAGNDRWIGDTSGLAGVASINLNAPADVFLGTGRLQSIESMNTTFGASGDLIVLHATSGMGDTVRGGGGNDRITAWMGGTDLLNGNAGTRDMLIVTGTSLTAGVELDVSGSVAAGYNGSASDGTNTITIVDFENFRFTGVGTGNDTIRSGNGVDRLIGAAGNDFLASDGGVDVISGGAGADTINGGAQVDRLTGGADEDVFVFARNLAQGRDRITDFTNGDDRIRIAGSGMDEVTIASINDGANTLVTLDSGTSIILIGVAAGTINAADFLFV
jgi:serralysin